METEQGLFERIIRTDERAQEAHRRLDAHDNVFEKLNERIGNVEKGVNQLRVQVEKLNTKVAVAAAIGSLLGGGAIAVLVTVIHPG